MANTEHYQFAGRNILLSSPDLQAIVNAATGHYKINHHPGLTLVLFPDNSVPWRYPQWFVSFNEQDDDHAHDWFNEASSDRGVVYSRNLHGPRTLDMFVQLLTEGLN